ncbi:hypothetical protein DP939_17750 [Spongiactinospora rosea]|uniref:Uncharacterized protein n=1 Tax=Spongiactinospora rosea TaxID=2248750 RepID=A0A366LZQ7_9ACTN|nr:hypothetical protein [Spongiactinospora rosea]RBQ19023.1 hypothetical protein DP939_17750 [Spongiactinospora rosea]
MMIVGVLLMIQGFGNALTRWLWGTDWGLLAVAGRAADLPPWAGVAVGLLGLVVAVAARLQGHRA